MVATVAERRCIHCGTTYELDMDEPAEMFTTSDVPPPAAHVVRQHGWLIHSCAWGTSTDHDWPDGDPGPGTTFMSFCRRCGAGEGTHRAQRPCSPASGGDE